MRLIRRLIVVSLLAGSAALASNSVVLAAGSKPGLESKKSPAGSFQQRLTRPDLEHTLPPRRVQLAQNAKTPAKAASPASAWAVTCSDRFRQKFQCEMTQNLINGKTRRSIVFISIKGTREGDGQAMLFRLFHGVYIPSGLWLSIDGKGGKLLPFQRTDAAGVYAARPLDKAFVNSLRRGRAINLKIEVEKGKPLELNAALRGFSQAFDRISKIR